ncbi:MAG: ferric reductase [Catenulispora sp. 13_1_20CM_3_70_7]|nr:ferredoxin reductase family protein [Catenulisporales bacterium]OLE25242.1 MAG: ferric reductase [Catenulispora sp. 13_1_20CM_3_70_7]
MSTTALRREAARPGPARPGGSGRAKTSPELVPRLALVLLAFGAAMVLAAWWHSTSAVTGAAGWLTGAGRLTGLLAGYVAPVLLLLMARIPVLERRVGSDRSARWHAFGGRYLVYLVTAHILTITWGYALTDGRNPLAEGVDIVFHYPEMIKGALATILMLGTGAVSARAARRRMSYETWYYLHLATYLAIALSFSHQIVNGAELSVQPEQTLWSAYYALAAVILGWYRLLVPYLRDRRHRLQVHSVAPEGPGVYSVVLRGEHLEELKARPGQFFRLQFQTRGLRWVASPYSLSAAPLPNFLRFTVKNLGEHSAAVAGLRPGTKVRAEGPYGAFTEDKARSARVLLIAAGVGITPIRALFETLPGQLTLLYRAGSDEEILFRSELEQIANRRGARLVYLVGSRRRHGGTLTAKGLSQLVPALTEHDVYLCGPEPMRRSVIDALRRAGVRGSRIHHESFEF